MRTPVLIVLAVSLAGCSLFSQTPDPKRRSQIRDALPYGLPMEEAAARLSTLDFACQYRQGEYFDEANQTRSAPRLLSCEQRPARVSFFCLNRDRVTVLPKDDKVNGIEVTRGPSCTRG
jgi:hypothetical protein